MQQQPDVEINHHGWRLLLGYMQVTQICSDKRRGESKDEGVGGRWAWETFVAKGREMTREVARRRSGSDHAGALPLIILTSNNLGQVVMLSKWEY